MSSTDMTSQPMPRNAAARCCVVTMSRIFASETAQRISASVEFQLTGVSHAPDSITP